MRKGTQQGGGGKSGGQLRHWLERMVREKVQEFIQEILEDEVTRFLGGRAKSQRRASVGAAGGVVPGEGNRSAPGPRSPRERPFEHFGAHRTGLSSNNVPHSESLPHDPPRRG
ncbi:MAG: hypothetical protein OXQ94_00165 [Gemmatimonadota bacterium]|nr:hypothetical protein [Gemmatimonadota bacterium]MDE2870095.1 hypothetical protein [Gemmatimonadota bacterium]